MSRLEGKPPNRELLRAQRRGGSVNNSKESLSYTRWECKYHGVFIPKYRKKSIYGWVRKELRPIMRGLAPQKEVVVEEGHLMPEPCADVVIDPAEVFGIRSGRFIKGKSAIAIPRRFMDRAKNFVGHNFWGERLLRIDGRSRRGTDPQLHQQQEKEDKRSINGRCLTKEMPA